MHRLNFIKAGLTLALSIVLEIVFGFVLMFFGNSDQPNWINLAYGVFHYPAIFLIFGWVDPDAGNFWQAVVWVLFLITVALLQWCLIILGVTWIIRYFRRKSA